MGAVDTPSALAAPPWFPVVGAMIGAAGGGVYVAARHGLPPTVASALAIACGLLITGAFHNDGLADMADAFGGGWTKERRMEILKDSRHGTYGVVSLVIVLIIQVASLASLSGRHGLLVLIAAEALARAGAIALMALMTPVRADGLAASSTRSVSRLAIVIGIVSGVVITVASIGWWSIGALGAVVVGVGAVGSLAQRKIGGVVGDVLGAAEQVAFTGVLVVCVALANRAR